MFHHILEYLFHAIVEAYIDQGHILIDKIFFNCMLTHLFSLRLSETNFIVPGFFITVAILIFKDYLIFRRPQHKPFYLYKTKKVK